MQISGGRTFQAEGTSSAKALRWCHTGMFEEQQGGGTSWIEQWGVCVHAQ